MPENTQTLFTGGTVATNTGASLSSPLGSGMMGENMSQTEKDAIMRQIHPIFLTTHSEEKVPVVESNFDKFLGFMRLCLEGLLKLVDIVVDAIIQVARLGVWIVAITGVLIVVTLMTNTTDKFIDLLNESIFKAFGIETRIAKVPSTANANPIVIPGITKSTNLKSDTLDSTSETSDNTTPITEEATNTDTTTNPHPRKRAVTRVTTPVE